MKKSFSSVWLLGLVVLFILMFSGYLAVTVNYSRAFKVKNQLLTMIEKQKCVVNKQPKSKSSIINSSTVYGDAGSLQNMCLYLYGSGYKTRGTCGDNTYPFAGNTWYGVKEFGIPFSGTAFNPSYEKAKKGTKYLFCVLKVNDGGMGNGFFYYIQLFYKLDLPVLGDLFTFNVSGNTAKIYGANNFCTSTVIKK